MAILDATVISHLQSCNRRSVLERTWKPPRWRAKTLWERELRQAIHELSTGADINEVVRVHRSRFFGFCANPGLDLPPGANSFIIAKDWAIMLEMVLRTLKRSTLLELKPLSAVDLGDGMSWRVLSYVDGAGVMHRWIGCDRWDQDELSRQVHGWWTFGDIAVTRRPLTLHVIEIGQVRSGRRDSCWTRGFRSRYAPNLPLRFKRPERSPKDFLPEYLADKRTDEEETEKWVSEILREGLAQKHILHLPLECPPDEVCQNTVDQIRSIAEKLRSLSGVQWSDVAMSRSACDGLVPCPWQDACYRWPPQDPEEAGYVRLDRESSSGLVRPEPAATVQVVSPAGSLEPSRS